MFQDSSLPPWTLPMRRWGSALWPSPMTGLLGGLFPVGDPHITGGLCWDGACGAFGVLHQHHLECFHWRPFPGSGSLVSPQLLPAQAAGPLQGETSPCWTTRAASWHQFLLYPVLFHKKDWGSLESLGSPETAIRASLFPSKNIWEALPISEVHEHPIFQRTYVNSLKSHKYPNVFSNITLAMSLIWTSWSKMPASPFHLTLLFPLNFSLTFFHALSCCGFFHLLFSPVECKLHELLPILFSAESPELKTKYDAQ